MNKSIALAADTQGGEIMIPIEHLPATTKIDGKNLAEITNRAVIARISQMLPATVSGAAGNLVSSAANTAMSNANAAANAAIKSANEALSKNDIYRVIIPKGAELAQSRQMEGAKRALFHGPKGIKGQANLVKVDAPKLAEVGPAKASRVTTVASGAANAMNVASLVVGQYYMAKISSQLETMSKGLAKISDFQDRQFKSRILSVMTDVTVISQFSLEIMENDEQRRLELSALRIHQNTATELLGQVNLTIDEITQKSLNYKDYQQCVVDLKLLVQYQNTLVSVLAEISRLTDLLGKGSTSTEHSYASYKLYSKQSAQTRTLLKQWHEKQAKALRIDLRLERMQILPIKIPQEHPDSKTEPVKAFAEASLVLMDDYLNHKKLKQGLAHEIIAQKNSALGRPAAPRPVYDEDVEIFIKGGKYYYLPRAE